MSDLGGTRHSFVVFRLGDEEYGLPIASVGSIIRFEPATAVPRAPQAVLGVINLRGRVIPVVDLAMRFGRERFAPTPGSRIIVAEGAEGGVGIAVDAASEVTSFAADDILPVPEGILTPETARAFSGVVQRGDSLVILIDLDEAMPRSEYVTPGIGDETGEERADV